MTSSFINLIATAVPVHDVHQRFIDFAPSLVADVRYRAVLKRMAHRCQIEHRYSFLPPNDDESSLDTENLYRSSQFPSTAKRMELYKKFALPFACMAVDQIFATIDKGSITHFLVTSCTGFYAPGVDLEIVKHYGLKASVERNLIGFMGCYAALNALKLARHIVRSDPEAVVLIVNLELCTLHLQETDNLEEMLSFLIFADGCAASIVSAKPTGIELVSFSSTILPSTDDLITWDIGDSGFEMVLSGEIPAAIASNLPLYLAEMLKGTETSAITYWAIHPGGRSILDAVQSAAQLSDEKLSNSRAVLRLYGNMSSATIMFVLKDLLNTGTAPGLGCGLAFGPGVTVESLMFRVGGPA